MTSKRTGSHYTYSAGSTCAFGIDEKGLEILLTTQSGPYRLTLSLEAAADLHFELARFFSTPRNNVVPLIRDPWVDPEPPEAA